MKKIKKILIETNADKLVEIVNKKGKIELEKAAAELKETEATIEEWAKILDEHKFIKLNYGVTGITLEAIKTGKLGKEKKAKEKPKEKKEKKPKKKEKKPEKKVKTEKGFECKKCGMKFSTDRALKTHKKLFHG